MMLVRLEASWSAVAVAEDGDIRKRSKKQREDKLGAFMAYVIPQTFPAIVVQSLEVDYGRSCELKRDDGTESLKLWW